MEYFVNLMASGLVAGSVYAMIAMGFAMIYRATGMLNFAQGELMMLVAYIAFGLTSTFGANLPVLLVGVFAAAILLGLLIERIFIRPMLGEPMFSRVMVTIALAVVIRGVTILIWGQEPHAMPRLLGTDLVRVGPVSFYPAQLWTLATLALLCVATWLFFNRTRFGVVMRATANSESTALLMGVNVRLVSAVAWAVSACFAAAAGLAFAFMFSVEPDMSSMGLRAFPAAILGGLDSVLGGALGGLVIGVVENLAGGYLGRGLKEIAGFLLIVVVLMVRPYGLFGQRHIERV